MPSNRAACERDVLVSLTPSCRRESVVAAICGTETGRPEETRMTLPILRPSRTPPADEEGDDA
jgi:hypothetical protein